MQWCVIFPAQPAAALPSVSPRGCGTAGCAEVRAAACDTTNSVRVSRLQLVTGHADLNTSTPQHPVQFLNLDFDTFVPMSGGNNLFKCLCKALMDS